MQSRGDDNVCCPIYRMVQAHNKKYTFPSPIFKDPAKQKCIQKPLENEMESNKVKSNNKESVEQKKKTHPLGVANKLLKTSICNLLMENIHEFKSNSK